jgi:DNA-binding MarR family transcriptional regulator
MKEEFDRLMKSKRKIQILRHLGKVGSDYNQKIALKLDITPGNSFNHLQVMQKYALVESFSNKKGKREIYYKLTPAGSAFIQRGGSE